MTISLKKLVEYIEIETEERRMTDLKKAKLDNLLSVWQADRRKLKRLYDALRKVAKYPKTYQGEIATEALAYERKHGHG